eukprot:gene1750-33159_t
MNVLADGLTLLKCQLDALEAQHAKETRHCSDLQSSISDFQFKNSVLRNRIEKAQRDVFLLESQHAELSEMVELRRQQADSMKSSEIVIKEETDAYLSCSEAGVSKFLSDSDIFCLSNSLEKWAERESKVEAEEHVLIDRLKTGYRQLVEIRKRHKDNLDKKSSSQRLVDDATECVNGLQIQVREAEATCVALKSLAEGTFELDDTAIKPEDFPESCHPILESLEAMRKELLAVELLDTPEVEAACLLMDKSIKEKEGTLLELRSKKAAAERHVQQKGQTPAWNKSTVPYLPLQPASSERQQQPSVWPLKHQVQEPSCTIIDLTDEEIGKSSATRNGKQSATPPSLMPPRGAAPTTWPSKHPLSKSAVPAALPSAPGEYQKTANNSKTELPRSTESNRLREDGKWAPGRLDKAKYQQDSSSPVPKAWTKQASYGQHQPLTDPADGSKAWPKQVSFGQHQPLTEPANGSKAWTKQVSYDHHQPLTEPANGSKAWPKQASYDQHQSLTDPADGSYHEPLGQARLGLPKFNSHASAPAAALQPSSFPSGEPYAQQGKEVNNAAGEGRSRPQMPQFDTIPPLVNTKTTASTKKRAADPSNAPRDLKTPAAAKASGAANTDPGPWSLVMLESRPWTLESSDSGVYTLDPGV